MLSRFIIWLRQSMYGRYGVDKLGFVTLGAYLVVGIVTRVFRRFLPAPALLVLLTLMAALLGATLFRMLSRNITRRAAENARFDRAFGAVKRFFTLNLKRIKDPRHVYAVCPNCRAIMRFKRVRGVHSATCRVCRTGFTVKVRL